MARKRLKPRLNLRDPQPPWREWPPDDGIQMFCISPNVWACWGCRKTAKTEVAQARTSRASKALMSGPPCCPQCRQPMKAMGMKWRPGRKGKWQTPTEIQTLAVRRAAGRAPFREGFVERKPQWSQQRRAAQRDA